MRAFNTRVTSSGFACAMRSCEYLNCELTVRNYFDHVTASPPTSTRRQASMYLRHATASAFALFRFHHI